MGTPWPENLCAHRIGTIEKLIKDRARDTAAQLQILSEKPTGDHDGPEELLVELLNSFTRSLSHISLCTCEDCECEVAQIPNRVGSPISDQRSENSGEGCKRPAAEDRSGCYKRRKISEMSMEVLSTTNEDGHAWRKYGQTKILEAQFPMCYYTCTHKFDQGCQATKRVQRIQEATPRMYRTTYFGHHTCRSYSPLLEAQNLRSFSSKTFSSDSESHPRSFSSIAISTQYTSSCPSSAASVRKECWGESGEIVLSNSLAGYFRDAPIVWSLVKSMKILNMNNPCFLSLQGSSQIKELPFSVSELPNLEGLVLAECTKLVNLAEFLNLEGSVCPFPNLEELFLEECTKCVKYGVELLDLEELVCPSPNLEELFMKLRCLAKLRKLIIYTRREDFPVISDLSDRNKLKKLHMLKIEWGRSFSS